MNMTQSTTARDPWPSSRRLGAPLVAALLSAWSVAGCDTSNSQYRPPAAAVNGGPTASADAFADPSDEAPPRPMPTRRLPRVSKKPSRRARRGGIRRRCTGKRIGRLERHAQRVEEIRRRASQASLLRRLAQAQAGPRDQRTAGRISGAVRLRGPRKPERRNEPPRHVPQGACRRAAGRVAAVDVGGLVRRFGKQAEMQFAMAADALKEMGYGAVGFGPADLRLSAGEIVAAVAGAEPKDSIFVSANVNLFGLTPKLRIIKAGGMKLGVTSVLGKEYQQQVNNAEVEMQPAAEALDRGRAAARRLRRARFCWRTPRSRSPRRWPSSFPQFNLVVTADGGDDAAVRARQDQGQQRALDRGWPQGHVRHRGRLLRRSQTADAFPARGARLALSRFAGNEATDGRPISTSCSSWAGTTWACKARAAPAGPQGRQVGRQVRRHGQLQGLPSEPPGTCGPTRSMPTPPTRWSKLDPPRQFDAECVSCHATGWNPQEFLPLRQRLREPGEDAAAGRQRLRELPRTGRRPRGRRERHATKPSATRPAQLLQLTVARGQGRHVPQVPRHDNSPEFGDNADRYWSEIEH